MSLLTSLVLTVIPDKPVTLPAYLARAVYRFFLEDIAKYDSQFSQALHDNTRRKPFTCSTVFGGTRLENDSQEFTPDNPAWLRITGLTQVISNHLQRMANQPPDTIELDGVSFQVTSATVDNQQHQWAGQTTYEALVTEHIARRRPRATLQIEFASPTTFRMTGKHKQTRSWPVPMPEWVFGSLYRQWNLFSPTGMDSRLLDFVQEFVVLSRYQLSTRAIPGKNKIPQMGCVGQAIYALIAEDAWQANQLHILSDFAFYSGIGYQTTTGLGQSRRSI